MKSKIALALMIGLLGCGKIAKATAPEQVVVRFPVARYVKNIAPVQERMMKYAEDNDMYIELFEIDSNTQDMYVLYKKLSKVRL